MTYVRMMVVDLLAGCRVAYRPMHRRRLLSVGPVAGWGAGYKFGAGAEVASRLLVRHARKKLSNESLVVGDDGANLAPS